MVGISPRLLWQELQYVDNRISNRWNFSPYLEFGYKFIFSNDMFLRFGVYGELLFPSAQMAAGDIIQYNMLDPENFIFFGIEQSKYINNEPLRMNVGINLAIGLGL